MGHEIAPGASYCAQGHPIALDQMQFPNDAYGGGGGYPQPGQPQQGYAPAPAAAYGAPPQPQQQGFGAPPPGYPGYAQQPQPGAPFGAAPPAAGYGGPPQQPPYGGAPQQPSYTPAPPAPQPYAAPPAPAAYGGTSDTSRDTAKVLRGFLVSYGTNPGGEFWPLMGGRLVVGRLGTGDGIDIQLQDPTISSRHAALVVDATNATIAIEDTGSTNGTFVNDEHIGFNGRRDLRDGDRIRFGGFTTVVKVIGRV